MSNIQLFQPGGVGTLSSDGRVHVGVRCYLYATGVTAISWTLTSVPAGSAAIIRYHPKLGPYFDPDVASVDPYVVRLTDTLTATHSNSFTGSTDQTGTPLTIDAPLKAEWFGVKADGRRITDGILRAGSTTLLSSTANFGPSDVGKKVLCRAASRRASGSLTGTAGSLTMNGSGDNFPVDLPIPGGGGGVGQPNCGAIYCGGYYIAVQYTDPVSHQLILPIGLPANITSMPFYVETQLTATIVAVVDAHTATLSAAATIDETSVPAFIATDDTEAIDAAITAAFATTHHLRLPSGLIGHSSNLNYIGQSKLLLEGAGLNATCFVDLRQMSFEHPYPMVDFNYGGLLNFKDCDGIQLSDFSYDGSVSVFGVNHSQGGTVNAGGGRGGIRFRNTPNSSVIRIGSQGYAARDEYIAAEVSPNMLVESCNCPQTNNVAVNIAGGGTNLRITKCMLGGGILVAGDSYTISGNIIFGYVGVGTAITVDCSGNGIVIGNTIHDGYSYASGAIDVFGTPVASATLIIANNNIFNMIGQYYTGTGVIGLKNYGGHATVVGNSIKNCTSLAGGGRALHASGASTGRVVFGPNTIGPGTNMTVGVYVHTDVPTNAVTVCQGTDFDDSVTTHWTLGATVKFPIDRGLLLEELPVDPPAPLANQVVIYAKDNGAGKTQACALFATGAVQVMATQP